MKKYLSLVVIFIVFFSKSLNAQFGYLWVPTGPWGANVTSSVIIDGDLFVGTNVVFYQYQNIMHTWTPLGDLPNLPVTSLYYDGSTTYAGVGNQFNSLFTSPNAGYNWTQDTIGLSGTANYNSFCSIGNTVFVACQTGGIYYSNDHGNSWSAATSPFAFTGNVYSLGSRLYVTQLFGGLIEKSDDMGQTWAVDTAGMGLGNPLVEQMFFSADTIYAVGPYVFTSTDSGLTWNRISGFSPSYGHYLSGNYICFDGTNFYQTSAGNSAVYKNTLGDTSWVNVTNNLPIGPPNIIFNLDSQIFIDVNGTLYTSTDEGATWSNASTGMTGKVISSLLVDSTDVYAGWTQGVYKSSDNGYSWAFVGDTFPIDKPVNAIHKFGSNIFAGTIGAGIYKTSDGGISWSTADSGLSGGGSMDIHCITDDGTNLYAGTGAMVYKSADNGNSWTSFSTALPQGAVFSLITIGANIYAGCSANLGNISGVYESPLSSPNWVLASNGLPTGAYPYSLSNFCSVIYAGLSSNGIYRSTDSGATWLPFNMGLSDTIIVNDVLVLCNNGAMYCATDSGVYFSYYPEQIQWFRYIEGLDNTIVNKLALDFNHDLLAATPATIFRVEAFVGVNNVNPIAKWQAYPNPSADGTWQLKVDNELLGSVVQIYDMNGKLLWKSEIRNQNSIVNLGGNMNAGAYIIQLTSKAQINNRLLIKE